MKRSVLALLPLVAISLTGALTACGGASTPGSDGAAGPVPLTLYLSGDVTIKSMWDNVIIPGFAKANPGYSVKVVFSEHGTNDTTTLQRLTAAEKTGQSSGEDIVEAGFVQTAAAGGLLAPVTATDVPNLAKVSPAQLTAVDGAGVPYRGSSVVLAYDSKFVPSPPKTLDQLVSWIGANPGKFTYNTPSSGGAGQAFAQTVLDRYVPAADLTTMDKSYAPQLESDWNKGWQVLHGLTKDVYQGIYPNGNIAALTLLGDGQISMAPVWSDQSLSGLKSGQLPPTVKLTQISDPSLTGSPVYLGIPKNVDGAHRQAAYKLENWLLDPANQTQIVNAVQGYPAIEQQYLPAATAGLFAGLDTSRLRPPYQAKMQNDMKLQWQKNVP